jgi:hypothetical protein
MCLLLTCWRTYDAGYMTQYEIEIIHRTTNVINDFDPLHAVGQIDKR